MEITSHSYCTLKQNSSVHLHLFIIISYFLLNNYNTITTISINKKNTRRKRGDIVGSIGKGEIKIGIIGWGTNHILNRGMLGNLGLSNKKGVKEK